MISDVYALMGNRVRANLVICLSRGAKNVGELIANCGLAQSAVSQHLAKLKTSRIVRSEKVGKEVYYSLRYPKAARIGALLAELEQEIV